MKGRPSTEFQKRITKDQDSSNTPTSKSSSSSSKPTTKKVSQPITSKQSLSNGSFPYYDKLLSDLDSDNSAEKSRPSTTNSNYSTSSNIYLSASLDNSTDSLFAGKTSKGATAPATKSGSTKTSSSAVEKSSTPASSGSKNNNANNNTSTGSNGTKALYEEMIDKCKASGKPFTDKEFPPSDSSLYVDPKNPPSSWPKITEWKRITDMFAKPQMFVEGIEPGDVIQGALGDCWFLGALSVVATRADLLLKCIPQTTLNQWGVYEFRFYKNGKWVSVLIDDYIPLHKGRPVFSSCHDINEVWVMLMEKAYAKLHK